MINLLLSLLAALLVLGGCASAVSTEGTIVVTGVMNKVVGGDDCWVIEVGTKVADKKFYQVDGDASLVRKVQKQDAKATLRIRLDSTATPRCRIGTPATVVDIISLD
jgi:hypothetical protein